MIKITSYEIQTEKNPDLKSSTIVMIKDNFFQCFFILLKKHVLKSSPARCPRTPMCVHLATKEGVRKAAAD
jgi:hypothetical protein